MSILDFKEIQKANMSDYKSDIFEYFAEEFFKLLGFEIVSSPGRGADGGKDLIIREIISSHIISIRKQWLVSCKHSAHSNRAISKKDEVEIVDRLKRHNCQGFIGFYSVGPTQDLVDYFEALTINDSIQCTFFQYSRIESKLLQTQDGVILAKRYFPESGVKLEGIASNNKQQQTNKTYLSCSSCKNKIHSSLPDAKVCAWGYESDAGKKHTEIFEYFCSEKCADEIEALVETSHFEQELGYWTSHFSELQTREGFYEFLTCFGLDGSYVSTVSEKAKEHIVSTTKYLTTIQLFGS
ncbi:restriction endonuclease [Vibrio vulnificus]